jgi:predicted small lipoprotein YifL
MKARSSVFAALAGLALLFALGGCQKNEGPMERAGKEVDNAATKAGEKIEKAGDTIQDAAKGDRK